MQKNTKLFPSLWWSWYLAIDAHIHTNTHTCAWPCPCPNSPSIVRGSNGVDQLQLRHPFTLPPSLSPNPPFCVTTGPSFLPSFLLTQRPGGVAGESGWPDVPWSDRQKDWQGTDMQTGGCCGYCGLWARFCSHPELQWEWHHSCFDRTTGRWWEMDSSRECGWEYEGVWGNKRKS